MPPRTDRAASPERREDLERLFVTNLPVVNGILAIVCRRHRLIGEAAEDFASWATMRLIADDYAILAKFRGESALSTYLTSVVVSLVRDYRHSVDGRWRPSASAVRSGAVGVRLERLLVRDGLALRHAGEMLRTAGHTTMNDRELAALSATFPRRSTLRPVQYVGDVEACVAASDPPPMIEEDDDDGTSSLAGALATLPPDDRNLVELVFWRRMSVADCAREMAVPQKPLYRRLQRTLASLRRCMESENGRAIELAGVRRRRLARLSSAS